MKVCTYHGASNYITWYPNYITDLVVGYVFFSEKLNTIGLRIVIPVILGKKIM